MRFDLLEMSIQPSNLLSCFFAQSLLLRLRSMFFVAQPPFWRKKTHPFSPSVPVLFSVFFRKPLFFNGFPPKKRHSVFFSSTEKIQKTRPERPLIAKETSQKVLQNLFFRGVKRGQLSASCLFRLPKPGVLVCSDANASKAARCDCVRCATAQLCANARLRTSFAARSMQRMRETHMQVLIVLIRAPISLSCLAFRAFAQKARLALEKRRHSLESSTFRSCGGALICAV